MDPPRVTVDESVVMAAPDSSYDDLTAEIQANYLERTQLLALASGYLEALHFAFADGCDAKHPDQPSDRPGIAAHRDVGDLDNEVILKPGFHAAALFDLVMGDAAFESSMDLGDPELYGLRFRDIDNPARQVTAIWSSAALFDRETERILTVPVRVANNNPFDLYYRIPSDPDQGIYENVCGGSVQLPIQSGGIHHEVIDNIQVEESTGHFYIQVPVSGAPLYLVSDSNHVRQEEGSFTIHTLAGLQLMDRTDAHQVYEIEIQIEEEREPGETLTIVLPTAWIAPQTQHPDQPGYVTLAGGSRSLQGMEQELELSADGNEIVITLGENAQLLPGCQFSILYGDYRHAARLLDMGPQNSGPVDLDFLKMSRWMTAYSTMDFRSGDEAEAPPFTHLPAAGWVYLPNDESVLGSNVKRVKREWPHPSHSIYRDYSGLVLRNDQPDQGHPNKQIWPLLLRDLEPGVEYDLTLYLNVHESEFEECEPNAGQHCPGKKVPYVHGNPPETSTLYLPDMTKQTVAVVAGTDTTDFVLSTKDRYFRVAADSAGELRVLFKHGGDNQGKIPEEPELDNMIYCYGLDLHPALLGGGPIDSDVSGPQVIEYRINGQTVATGTITIRPTYVPPIEP